METGGKAEEGEAASGRNFKICCKCYAGSLHQRADVLTGHFWTPQSHTALSLGPTAQRDNILSKLIKYSFPALQGCYQGMSCLHTHSLSIAQCQQALLKTQERLIKHSQNSPLLSPGVQVTAATGSLKSRESHRVHCQGKGRSLWTITKNASLVLGNSLCLSSSHIFCFPFAMKMVELDKGRKDLYSIWIQLWYTGLQMTIKVGERPWLNTKSEFTESLIPLPYPCGLLDNH